MTSAPLTVLELAADQPLGRLAASLAESGHPVRTVRVHAGEAVPADLGAGLVVLGGRLSAYDDAAAPWLADVRTALLGAARSGVPTLAVGLGAQLLAVAGGGHVEVAAPPGVEAGAVRIFWRPEARTDAVVRGIAQAVADAGGRSSRFVTAHADAVSELPADAVWLASSNTYPFQAFRLGSALGVQFHPEADAGLVEQALDAFDPAEREAVLTDVATGAEQAARDGAALGAAFVAHVQASVPRDALVG